MVLSCQQEESERIRPEDLDNTIPKDSELAILMQNIVTHDGSYDDLVDGGNCFSIQLPYSLYINDQLTVINEVSDYSQITDMDVILIQYPIKITKHNYEEAILQNSNQLSDLIADCKIDDDDIECIDFIYPVRLSLFNRNTNSFSELEVIHDFQFYEFMEDIGEETVISINYPIEMLLHNGENSDAGHNEQLKATILEVANGCDENDD